METTQSVRISESLLAVIQRMAEEEGRTVRAQMEMYLKTGIAQHSEELLRRSKRVRG